jgi:hypothetical protein
LRRRLLKRGVTITAVVLTGLLETHAAQFAPEGLGASIAAAALSKAAGSTPVLALLQEALRKPFWPKLVSSATAVLVLAGLTGAAVHAWPRQTPRPPSYSFQSKIVQHSRVVIAVAANSTSAAQPVPSDGATPPATVNTTPQPPTDASPIQSTPTPLSGVTNATATAPAIAANLSLSSGWPRSAYLTNAAPWGAESAADGFGGQQVPDAGAGAPTWTPFMAPRVYQPNWRVPARGMQALPASMPVQTPVQTWTPVASVQPWAPVQRAPTPMRATAGKRTTGPRQ